MNKLLTLTIASELFLCCPFDYWGGPLLYLAIDDLYSNHIDANIGLGLAFMFTWIYSLIALIVAISLIVKRNERIIFQKKSNYVAGATIHS
ncbi:hypothetical protein F6Y05_00930 [Bacillus megaterium]|nr:hypothetical protein [Priestia megaterium]